MIIPVTINGVKRELNVLPYNTVLEVLRREGYLGVKKGCSEGNCGSCIILVDNIPRKSCLLLIGQIINREITTIEGLETAEKPHPLQDALVEKAGIQCGFCIPGLIMSAAGLLHKNPNPSESEIKKALDGNLCRCTGYVKQIEAVQEAARVLRGDLQGGAGK